MGMPPTGVAAIPPGRVGGKALWPHGTQAISFCRRTYWWKLRVTVFALIWQVKRVYEALLESKEERWDQCRGGVADCLRELAEHHGGEVRGRSRSSIHGLVACTKSRNDF